MKMEKNISWNFQLLVLGRDYDTHVEEKFYHNLENDIAVKSEITETTRCKKKPCTFWLVNNVQVTKLTTTKFTDNVTDIHRFVYAKFGGLKTL